MCCVLGAGRCSVAPALVASERGHAHKLVGFLPRQGHGAPGLVGMRQEAPDAQGPTGSAVLEGTSAQRAPFIL